MTLDANHMGRPVEDPVSNVLKWALLAVAIVTFALRAWATTEARPFLPQAVEQLQPAPLRSES